MTSDSRQRMIETAATVMRERGVEATSFSAVIERSGAPRGSIYHHFPGGKSQLIEEATRYAGEFTASGLAAALGREDPIEAIRAFNQGWIRLLRKTDFGAGCPVVAAALEGDRSPGARAAAAESFAAWEQVLGAAFEPHVESPERARALATLVIASVEGAVVLARAEQSAAPIERVARELEKVLGGALS